MRVAAVTLRVGNSVAGSVRKKSVEVSAFAERTGSDGSVVLIPVVVVEGVTTSYSTLANVQYATNVHGVLCTAQHPMAANIVGVVASLIGALSVVGHARRRRLGGRHGCLGDHREGALEAALRRQRER